VCPKTPDSLNFTLLFDDIKHMIPNITTSLAKDLIKYWLAGSGLENMNAVSTYNLTYLTYLESLYKKWSHGNTHQGFFDAMQVKSTQCDTSHQRGADKCQNLKKIRQSTQLAERFKTSTISWGFDPWPIG
jgi:hypothetical protein